MGSPLNRQVRRALIEGSIEGLIQGARQMRTANRYPSDHVIQAELPWRLYWSLSELQRRELLHDHHVRVVEATDG